MKSWRFTVPATDWPSSEACQKRSSVLLSAERQREVRAGRHRVLDRQRLVVGRAFHYHIVTILGETKDCHRRNSASSIRNCDVASPGADQTAFGHSAHLR